MLRFPPGLRHPDDEEEDVFAERLPEPEPYPEPEVNKAHLRAEPLSLIQRTKKRVLGDVELARAQRDDKYENALGTIGDGLFYATTGKQKASAPRSHHTDALLQHRQEADRSEHRSVLNAQRQEGIKAKQAEAARQAALDDPDSEESKALRSLFSATEDGKAIAEQMGEAFHRLPGSKLPGGKDMLDHAMKLHQLKARSGPRELTPEELARIEAQTGYYNAQAERARRGPVEKSVDPLKQQQAAAHLDRTKALAENAKNAEVMKYASHFRGSDIKPMLDASATLDRIIEQYGGIEKVPGVGFVFGGGTPGQALPPGGQEFRQTAESLIAGYRNKMFGASLTDSEKAAFEKIANLGPKATASQVGYALSLLKKAALAKADENLLGASDETKARIRKDLFTPSTSHAPKAEAKPAAAPANSKIAAAEKWLRDNPNDPDAEAVRAKLKKLMGAP